MADEILDQVTSCLRRWYFSYYFWSAAFYLLCLSIIALPIVISTGLIAEKTVKILAAVSAACAAVATWSNLNRVATQFEAAAAHLRFARLQYFIDHDAAKLRSELVEAHKFLPPTPGLPGAGPLRGR